MTAPVRPDKPGVGLEDGDTVELHEGLDDKTPWRWTDVRREGRDAIGIPALGGQPRSTRVATIARVEADTASGLEKDYVRYRIVKVTRPAQESSAPAPPPLTIDRAIAIARGCVDYSGGYSDGPELDAFRHGIDTVVKALEAAAKDATTLQVRVLESIGAGQGAPAPPASEAAALLAALAPLIAIADAYDANALDDEARKTWGPNDEHTNQGPAYRIVLYSGRGGATLLTLADCFAARDTVRGGGAASEAAAALYDWTTLAAVIDAAGCLYEGTPAEMAVIVHIANAVAADVARRGGAR